MLDYSASSIDESGVWRQMCGGSAAQGAVMLCCLPAVIHLHLPYWWNRRSTRTYVGTHAKRQLWVDARHCRGTTLLRA